MMSVIRVLAFWAVLSGVAHAQFQPFTSKGFEQLNYRGNSCTGFFDTPSWRCMPITVPVYLARAKDNKAVVLITHGAHGLDLRHAKYGEHLAASGFNAVIVGHWEARGLSNIHLDYDKARRQGGDSPNMVLDAMAIISQMSEQAEWKDSKFGHLGESIGGVTAMNLTRPYLRRAHVALFGKEPPKWSALVALYPGCHERNTIERFLPYPLLFILGADDDVTPAKDCEQQVPWMNGRGGNAQVVVLPDQVHDFDRLDIWRRVPQQNPAKCANIRDGDSFTLQVNGAKFPGTPEGYAQMRRECIAMSPPYGWSGNKGNAQAGYPEWTSFLKSHLF